MKMLPLAAFAALCAVAGNAFAAPVVMPPAVPQPSKGGDVVGFILQNPGAAAAPGHMVTFGQAFPVGAMLPTQALAARDSDKNRNVQMDVLATHPDGSVRFAAISMAYPEIAAHGTLGGMLVVRGPYAGAPFDLAAAAPKLTVTLVVTKSPLGAFTKTYDLGAALQTELASASPDYWLRGPIATQVRVDVPVGASMHLTADITGYKNNTIVADVQFNNDYAMGKIGGSFAYGATVSLDGKVQKFPGIAQDQYQDWHTVIATHGVPAVNVQHDVAFLEKSTAILTYDLTTGVATTLLQGFAALAQTATFGTPLATNGVTTYMPNTGGRADIGYTTQYNAVWAMTQDQRAATVGLAQGDSGGSVPWNFKLANGRWLTPHDFSDIYATYQPQYLTGLTQPSTNTIWTPDTAHQPNLSYIPYLMTATRWYLDRLNAQAAAALTQSWPGYRCLIESRGLSCTADNNWHVINFSDQVRAEAWSMREIVEAGWIGKSGSFEAGYFAQIANKNWHWVAAQVPSLNQSQGQVAGWVQGQNANPGAIPPWQQDYFTGILVLAARMGDPDAQQVLAWNQNWVTQRFLGAGMNPHDGCTYNLPVADPTSGVFFTTWAQVEQASIARGQTNGNGWAQSNGDYCQLARASLGAVLSFQPSNTAAKQALTWLQNSGAPYIDQATFQNDPSFNVVPPK